MEKRGCIIYCIFLFLMVVLLTFHLCTSEKIRYASSKECDRYSLDALYHERYKLITNNIFSDIKEFVSRVADLVADSLISIMGEMRDESNNEEKKVYIKFRNAKSAFTGKVKKIQKNITSSWEDLVTSHLDLMLDNGKSSLEDYINKTVRMTDSYSTARKILDDLLSQFVDFIKGTVRDGLAGIKIASEYSLKKEEEEEKENRTKDEDGSQNKKSNEDALRDKMVEIAKMIVPGFLKNVTVEVIQRNMDLTKASGIKPEDRDSVLNDIEFDMILIKNRIRAIGQSDIPKDLGAINLARRSIFIYWADMAEEMYKEKLQAKKSKDKSTTGRVYYRNLWQNEEKALETLLNLMEVYP